MKSKTREKLKELFPPKNFALIGAAAIIGLGNAYMHDTAPKKPAPADITFVGGSPESMKNKNNVFDAAERKIIRATQEVMLKKYPELAGVKVLLPEGDGAVVEDPRKDTNYKPSIVRGDDARQSPHITRIDKKRAIVFSAAGWHAFEEKVTHGDPERSKVLLQQSMAHESGHAIDFKFGISAGAHIEAPEAGESDGNVNMDLERRILEERVADTIAGDAMADINPDPRAITMMEENFSYFTNEARGEYDPTHDPDEVRIQVFERGASHPDHILPEGYRHS